MSQPVLVKVYGGLSPVNDAVFAKLFDACAGSLPQEEEPPLRLEKNLAVLSFEGVCFPIEDFIAELGSVLSPEMSGRIDYLDLENWAMTRYVAEGGKIRSSGASLNNVMDYSGF